MALVNKISSTRLIHGQASLLWPFHPSEVFSMIFAFLICLI